MQNDERDGRLPGASRRRFLGGVATSSLLASGVTADQRLRRRSTIPGVKALRTRGSITAHSNRLKVTNAAGFAVGDSLIIELGGEAGRGLPGSPGVGGAWPALTYPDEAAMRADASQATNTWCYCVGSGRAYIWNTPAAPKDWFNEAYDYYWEFVVPLALRAKITSVVGDTLTLDTASAVNSANANVHFDNAPVFNAYAHTFQAAKATDVALIWPEGNFAVGEKLSVSDVPGLLIAGAGQSRTKLFSPKGVISVSLTASGCSRCEVRDLTLAGNAYLTSGWGLDLTQVNAIHRPTWWYALNLVGASHCHAHDLTITYPWQGAVAHNCTDCTFSRIKITSDGLQCYVSWAFNWVNSAHCWAYDCEVTSTYITKGFECFASNDCGFIRPVARNATFALNSTGGCIIDSPRVVLTANSILSPRSIPEKGTPVFDINQNIDQNRGQPGNAILNMNVVQLGYLNTSNDSMIGVNISSGRNTVVKGGVFSAPDYKPPSKLYGAQAVNANAGALNTKVEGLSVKGRSRGTGGYANIAVVDGSVSGCTALSISCAGPRCNAENDIRPAPGRARDG